MGQSRVPEEEGAKFFRNGGEVILTPAKGISPASKINQTKFYELEEWSSRRSPDPRQMGRGWQLEEQGDHPKVLRRRTPLEEDHATAAGSWHERTSASAAI